MERRAVAVAAAMPLQVPGEDLPMTILLIAIHVTVCLFLIFVVLLQSAQAADLAGAFGGGGSQTALGMRGAATLLQKATTAAAVMFMVTSLALGIVGRRSVSVIEGLQDSTPPVEAPASTEGGGADQGVAPAAEEQSAGEQESGDQDAADQGAGGDPGSAASDRGAGPGQ